MCLVMEDSNPGFVMEDSNPPGLRCPHCAGPLFMEAETSSRTSVIKGVFATIGCAVGGTASAFYGVNRGMPVVQRFVKGPLWLQCLVGVPPLMLFSSTCARLAGGAAPAVAQFFTSSPTSSSSSLPTPASQGEEKNISRTSSVL